LKTFFVFSNQIISKCAKVEQLSSSSSSSGEEGVPEGVEDLISTDGEEDLDIEVEVVDLEEDQRTPSPLPTRDGLRIQVISFNESIPDSSTNISEEVTRGRKVCNKYSLL
jgi:hypothetical protein